MTAKDMVKILEEDGWTKKKQKGSHLQMVHPTKRGKVTVTMHNKELTTKTYNSILRQAGLK